VAASLAAYYEPRWVQSSRKVRLVVCVHFDTVVGGTCTHTHTTRARLLSLPQRHRNASKWSGAALPAALVRAAGETEQSETGPPSTRPARWAQCR